MHLTFVFNYSIPLNKSLSKLFESDDLKYKSNSYLKPLIGMVKTKNTKALEYYDKIELFVTKILLNVD